MDKGDLIDRMFFTGDKVSAKGKDQYQIVLSKTPFYAESGGQVGDTGRLEDHSRMFFVEITNTKKENGVIVHYADTLPEDLEGGFWAVIDEDKEEDRKRAKTSVVGSQNGPKWCMRLHFRRTRSSLPGRWPM